MVLSQRFASQGRIEETNAGFELVRKSEVQSFENRTKEKIHALTRKEMLPKIIIMSVIISIPVNSHLRSTWMPRVSVIPRLLRSERIWVGSERANGSRSGDDIAEKEERSVTFRSFPQFCP